VKALFFKKLNHIHSEPQNVAHQLRDVDWHAPVRIARDMPRPARLLHVLVLLLAALACAALVSGYRILPIELSQLPMLTLILTNDNFTSNTQ
jgi:hypothetical protein